MAANEGLVRLLIDLESDLISLPQSPEVEALIKIAKQIRGLNPISYEELDPQDVANLVIEKPEVVRSGLELSLTRNEDAFRRGVPQIFDEQTGLYNKTYFEKRLLPSAIERAGSEGVPLSYLLLDLDKFHDFNESYGKKKGDEAIAMFSALLKKSFRTMRRNIGAIKPFGGQGNLQDKRREYLDSLDIIGRMPGTYTPQGRVGGGEEFAVILYGSNETNALTAANRFLEEVRKIRVPYDGRKLTISASGGIAQYQNGTNPEQLTGNAERALKHSKDNGRDRVTLFSTI